MRRVKMDSIKGKKLRVKRMAVLLLLLATFFITGCSMQTALDAFGGKNAGSGQPDTEASTTETADSGSTVLESDRMTADRVLYAENARSCILQQDAEYLYVCGSYRVARIDKQTGETFVLWENEDQVWEQKEYLYRNGSGLLINERIYFIERWETADDRTHRAFSCVNTDGTGYERIEELAEYCVDDMLLQDGILCIEDDDKEIWYQVLEDGSLAERDILMAKDSEQKYYISNGDRIIFHKENVQHPGIEEIESYNEQYFVVKDYAPYDGSGVKLKLVDRENGEERQLTETDCNVIYMDDTYLYVFDRDWQEQSVFYRYEKITLETGEHTVLFTRDKAIPGLYASEYLMDVVVQNHTIYYVDERNGKYYLMYRSLENPEEEKILGPEFYDTGISSIGTIQQFYKEYFMEGNAENPAYVLDLSLLEVNDSFAGAKAINSYLAEYKNQQIAYAESAFEEEKEWMDPKEMGVAGQLSSSFSGFDYFDSRYISFVQAGYNYMSGSAHGMPYWNGMTFDLQTGKRLALSDIIGNSETELKEIVTSYFAEKINAAPEDYWEDAITSVQEWTSLESSYYLTSNGIVFYYEPYALACYAAGFRYVTIPYDEFEMKITLEKAVQGKLPLTADGKGWGLSYGEPGAQPVGNESPETLAQYDAFYVGNAEEKVIYLTFDCGYENGNTEPILDALKKHDATATFFVVGHFLESAPELVKRMVAEGHTVGSHTYNHADVTTLSKTEFQEEMDAVREKLKEITGEELSMYYRPPEGKCSAKNLRIAQEMGYSTFFWSLAHVDWDPDKQPGQKEAIEKLTSRIHPGAIVLLHNTSKTNGEILDELLTKWEEMGYEVRPLSELTIPYLVNS